MERAWLVALLISCGSAPPATEKAAPAKQVDTPATVPKKVGADQTLTTAQKSTVLVPTGWWYTQTEDRIVIEDPEREIKLYVVDLVAVPNSDAIAAAWKLVRADFARPIRETVSPPADEGWDELTQVSYEVPADESRAIIGTARRKNDTAFVLLLDAPAAAFGRRGAQLRQILQSQKAPGGNQESFAGKKARPFDAAIEKEFEAFFEKAMVSEKVPGAAVAIVQDGKVVYEKGFGVRQLGGKPVTPQTRFMIGSTTKSFTSLMMAILVDRKVVTWETKLKELLPEFAAGEPALVDQVLLQHSVCACTGLPRQDLEFLFQFKGVTPAERLKELAGMKPTTGFGETFQYSNALVSAGGYAAARALYPKKSLADAYEAALTETVLKPIGLSATLLRTDRVMKTDHAMPHGAQMDGTYVKIPIAYEGAVTSVLPAGGLWSNVEDLATLMLMELGGGQAPNGKQIVSPQNLIRRREPSVKIGLESYYGLGLMVDNSKELIQIGHGGNTLGFTAAWNFFPDRNFGIVILSNAAGANTFTGLVERRLVELMLDGLIKADPELEFAAQQSRSSRELVLSKLTDPPPKEWITPLLGKYTNESLGDFILKAKGKQIIADVGEWTSTVAQHTEAGQSVLLLTGPPFAGLPFLPQPDGSLLLDAGQQKYFFKKN